MGEPQGAGARLPGVYFQRGLFFAVACYYFCARRRGRSVARRSSCVARALRGGLWRRRFCQSGRRVARREVVALRGGLWRRRRFCQSASRARCGAVCGGGGGLWREEVVALRGGLWRRRRSVAAVCGSGGGLWREEVVALRARCGAVCGGGVAHLSCRAPNSPLHPSLQHPL